MEVAAAKQLLPMARGPNSPSSSTSSSSPSSVASPSRQSQPVCPSPKPVPRVIDTTPFPTTFVQADTTSFKQVVQMLTGSDTTSSSYQKPAKNHHHGGVAGVPCRPKKPAFKLYQRRSGLKNLKMIAPLAMSATAGASPRKTPEILSPSVLDFPSLALGSPVTPLVADPFNRSASPGEEEAVERAAIARKGFFLHPSPRGAEPPRLLPLFPVTSPRMASSAAAAPSSQ
ncbi:VQ motif-containing protein 4-like [Phragmites australis]|uniref:VQ motif-containing protein 4-like n=1 Tax=Phragmites australis TaxID=29695 RepID=UPI002D771017|nr:VQ motif-containing protein 4-like [Phragmites australis]